MTNPAWLLGLLVEKDGLHGLREEADGELRGDPLGESMVRLRMIGRVSPKRIACVAALGVLGLLGGGMSALALSLCVATVLAILAMSEAGWLDRLRPPREAVAD